MPASRAAPPAPMYDADVWNQVALDDLWVYDKLILARKLGHVCGPAGVPLPAPGTYVVRPITNMMGMGLGTEIVTFDSTSTEHLRPGTFWTELFTGEHLSVDVTATDVLCVYRGTAAGPQRFTAWQRLPNPPLEQVPPLIRQLAQRYSVVNYESVGGRIIEVHLRPNPDWLKYRARMLVPVWAGESTEHPHYVPDPDGERQGFLVYR